MKDLEKELEQKIDKLAEVEKECNAVKEQVKEIQQIKEEATKAKQEKEVAGRQLDEAVHSKAALASKCAMEIMRLTMILNTLQQHPKLKSLVQTLLEESKNNTKYVVIHSL